MRRDMQLRTKGPTQLWGDNQEALALVKDPVLNVRTKHIDVHHHAVCEHNLSASARLQINYVSILPYHIHNCRCADKGARTPCV
jgi:hypothetical protein